MLILRTLHGSHLYGLNGPDSDMDWYEVYNNRHLRRRAKQTIVDGIDTMAIDLTYYLHLCQEGVPQALETMMSNVAEIDEFSAFRKSYIIGVPAATRTYRRTIKNFYEAGDFKRRRHALRLYLNLLELQQTGRFDPRMNESQIAWLNANASDADWIMDI